MSQDVFKAPKAKRKHGAIHRRDSERWSPKKPRRTKEDFFTFCNIVLEYTQYETIKQEDLRRCNNTSPLDSAGSTAESFTSESTSSSISEAEHEDKLLESSSDFHDESSNASSKCDAALVDKSDTEDHSFVKGGGGGGGGGANSTNECMDSSNDDSGGETGDEDSWELVTCFCNKPFSGRPMIECSECLTWIHLSCAKIRKSNIPEDFICQKCKESKFTTRKSTRIRSEKKMISA